VYVCACVCVCVCVCMRESVCLPDLSLSPGYVWVCVLGGGWRVCADSLTGVCVCAFECVCTRGACEWVILYVQASVCVCVCVCVWDV